MNLAKFLGSALWLVLFGAVIGLSIGLGVKTYRFLTDTQCEVSK